jgi:hypothetical protein
MRRVLATVGLTIGFASRAVIAAEPVELLPLLAQPPVPAKPTPPAPPLAPPATPPTTTPPTTTPPTTTPPGLANPPGLAPVTNTVGAAPQSLASSGAGFTPYMMGDLPATGYARGTVSFPSLIPVVIPPVTVTIPQQIIRNSDGEIIAIIPAHTNVVTPGRTVLEPGIASRSILIPQTDRGGVNIDENESPRPVDRVFVGYNYFDNVTRPFPGVPGSNLNREMYGFELTFLNGDASIGVRMNSLQTTGDSSLSNDVFGDLTVITKFALINDRATGDVLSVGLAVTAPTGPGAFLPDGTRLNPTLIQPWSGFIYNWERVYTQGFSSLIIPTDARDSLISSSSVSFGYWLYRSTAPDALLTYITPVIEGHTTIGLTHRGLDQVLAGFPDTFVLTNGVHIGLGQRANLALGVGVPLTGPSPFNIEALAQLNWQF